MTSPLGFKARVDPLFACFCLSPVCHEFLRFTSGVTPVDCIEVSMVAGRVPYMLLYSRGRLPGFDLETS